MDRADETVLPDVDHVVLVSADDQPIGWLPKLEAHLGDGRLHRAFSVFLRDHDGRHLLQQRAISKYHFGGLWSNTCCSHPRIGERVLEAAARRLNEELGIQQVDLVELGRFTYEARDPESGLIEREIDHVVTGVFSGTASPDPAEVMACRWVSPSELDAELAAQPKRFTPWFPIALRRARELCPEHFEH